MLVAAAHSVPYPSWLNTGDNTWQMVAATFVGLMSLPGLAVLYASIVQKKWAVNVLAMMFAGFSLVLVAWVLWSYKMGFGATSLGGGVHNGVQTQLSGVGWVKHFFENFVGQAGPDHRTPPTNRARRCRRPTPPSPSTSRPPRWPTSSSCSRPSRRCCSSAACSAGSSSAPGACWCRCGRPSSTASTPSCCGAAATSPRRVRSTSPAATSSTCRPACRASWPPGSSGPGCCEIDNTPYPTTWSWRRWEPASCGSAGTASTAATRTTRAPTPPPPWSTPTSPPRPGVLVWMAMDAWFTKAKKPTFLGGVNGMICGLVGITPCAGFVNGWGAIYVGRHLHRRRLDRLELPVQGAALLQGGRRPRGHLHPRHRRLLRRPAARASSATRTSWSSAAAT